MPIIKSAIKRAKQTEKRRQRNIGIKRDIKSAIKAFTVKPSSAGLSSIQSELDKAVKKGLIKKNNAARRKSALAKIAKDAGVKLTSTKKPAPKKTTVKAAPKTTKKTTVKKALAAKKSATK